MCQIAVCCVEGLTNNKSGLPSRLKSAPRRVPTKTRNIVTIYLFIFVLCFLLLFCFRLRRPYWLRQLSCSGCRCRSWRSNYRGGVLAVQRWSREPGGRSFQKISRTFHKG